MRLVALDALTGETCKGFGVNGIVDVDPLTRVMTPDLGRGDMQFVSPPVLINDIVIVGSSDNTKATRSDNPSGAVRAFDARNGAVALEF